MGTKREAQEKAPITFGMKLARGRGEELPWDPPQLCRQPVSAPSGVGANAACGGHGIAVRTR